MSTTIETTESSGHHDQANTRKRRTIIAGAFAGAAVVAIIAIIAVTSGSDSDIVTSEEPVLREFDAVGDPLGIEDQEVIGRTVLRRTPDGLQADVEAAGLTPGGAYTIWLAAWQRGETFPQDVFAILADGMVVGDDGTLKSTISADLDQLPIEGFYIDGMGDIDFVPFTDPFESTIRIEIAYHGQAENAGDELNEWLSNFWVGDEGVCPSPRGTLATGAIPSQAYCPVYFVSVHERAE